jgi:hypothetical protein
VGQRRRKQQVGLEPRMELTQVVGQRRHRHRVFEQPAEVRVVPGSGAGGPTPLGPEACVGEQPVEKGAELAIMHLAREMLEKPVQFVEVTVRPGEKRTRINPRISGYPLDQQDLDYELVPEPLDPAGDPHKVTALEAPGQSGGIPESASLDDAGLIAELE